MRLLGVNNLDEIFLDNSVIIDFEYNIESESDEGASHHFQIKAQNGQQDDIVEQLVIAYENWAYEECENSVLLDEMTTEDDLLQVPIEEYLEMWLDRLGYTYIDLSSNRP